MAVKENINNKKGLFQLKKAETGIEGLDEITYGGLPAGRPTLVCGGPGSGKTVMSLEFLVRGATQFNEPGVFITFEEKAEDLASNVASLGFDLKKLVADKKLYIDHVRVERKEIEETGEYDLEALFVRIENAVNQVGAKRIVLDTIETLFSGLSNTAILRSELRRLFSWLKEKELTAIITGERGESKLTRQGLEEYVSDCVILLDHRVKKQASIRRMRIVKYRGSSHETNEFPFLIDEDGFSVLPISSITLDHTVSKKRISSGLGPLDEMMENKGFYKGSTVLVSGAAGTGKTSLASHFALSTCERGERVLYFTFEESPDQMRRNMKTIGIDIDPYIKKGSMKYRALRPSIYGLEMHLASMYKDIKQFKPDVVIIDPVSNLVSIGNTEDVRSMLTRLIDFLKSNQITALFTNLTDAGNINLENSGIGISSIIDTWLILRDIRMENDRGRHIYILKSRGMDHSRQVRDLKITKKGIKITVPDKV